MTSKSSSASGNMKTFDDNSTSSYAGKVLKMVRSKKNLRVAIIGRENVGKSTLFNSLLGRQHSIVHNSPGVTRDCQEAKTQIKLKYPMNVSEVVFDKKARKRLIKKISCTFIDTPGANFMESIIQQTQDSIASSNVALLVTDCRDGLQKWDYHVANYLEMKGIPALHILNKCDGPLMRGDSDELEEVISKNTIPSLGKPIPISSEMKIGMDQIVSAIQSYHFLTESLNEETLQKTRDELYQSVIESINQSRVSKNDGDYITLDDGVMCESEYDLADENNETNFFQPRDFKGEWENLPTVPSSRDFTETVKITHKDIENLGSKPQNYRQENVAPAPKVVQQEQEDVEEEMEEAEEPQELVNSSGMKEDNIMRLAIIGRSNVGKSTLLNHLIGEERTRTSSTPGTTRDTIEVEAINEKTGQHYLICDTAGIRKKKHTDTDRIEQMSLKDTYRTIKYANVCCLVVDPTHNISGEGYGLTQQDLDIARMVEKEGRSLVIACNKWDMVKNPYVVAQQIESQIESSLSQMQGISVVVCSAKTGKNLSLLLKECEKSYRKWSSKISTHQLNTFIRQYLETKPIPQSYPKVRYISQVAIRPPTFCIHTSNKKFPTNFERQIINAIRDEFELGGVPFRVIQKLNSKKNKNEQDN
ncbi:small GTPase [Naegleria gruberi]|uniref:GTPase Der n=1 Tax=Naegleria gruberi TaxID=5762 RepID=D2UZL1_NAEGR|nr:small GTPase [Naegleria gruberi]EFC50173.1 small GTPase [Naegleria gruberi]|eukprot:XP_002682917.1 small GTPase [Naegleria gruberi]